VTPAAAPAATPDATPAAAPDVVVVTAAPAVAPGPAAIAPDVAAPTAVAPVGPVSRLAAYAVDTVLVGWTFSAAAVAATFIARIVAGSHLGLEGDRDVAGLALAAWWFGYFAVSWGTTGRTPGMALFGIRVARLDGSPAGARHAVVRTLTFPLSALLLGLGFVGIVVHPQRRALHDLFAGTLVTYDEP
jgi:uncharacterized RDD family membrane protein YckC